MSPVELGALVMVTLATSVVGTVIGIMLFLKRSTATLRERIPSRPTTTPSRKSAFAPIAIPVTFRSAVEVDDEQRLKLLTKARLEALANEVDLINRVMGRAEDGLGDGDDIHADQQRDRVG